MIVKVRLKLDNDTDLLNLGFYIFGTEIICCLTNDMFLYHNRILSCWEVFCIECVVNVVAEPQQERVAVFETTRPWEGEDTVLQELPVTV